MTRWADLTDDQLDDRLTEDLRSMAEGADASADWTSRRLLPGVRARLSGRPERVPASRLAPLAAVGAVAGLIVLFALAAPSLGPGGATPSPEQTPPSEWSALNTTEFAQRLAAGELRGETHWVTGELSGVLVQCPPGGGLCPTHVLLGTAPSVDVHTRPLPADALDADAYQDEVAGVDWAWWQPPEVPLGSASVILSVTEDGLVEYVGYLSEAPFGVSSFALVDPASMSQSEVHVVPGWLTAVGVGLPFSGPAPQPGTFIAGLPQRWSGSPAWLLDRPLRLDPEGFFRPEDGVQVQNRAYEMFADTIPTSRITEPVAGLWAVAPRLEGGGCPDDAPPCWRWNLVGALEVLPPGPAMPVPSPDVTPTAAPVDSPVITPSPGEAPTASPSPATAPTPSPPAGAVACADSDIEFTDHSGIVEACFVMPDDAAFGDDPRSAVNPGGDPSVLQVRWEITDPRICTEFAITLDLFKRNPEPLTNDARGFFAVADTPANSEIICFAVWTPPRLNVLELHLSQRVQAAEVEIGAVSRSQIDEVTASAGDFRLLIRSKPRPRPVLYPPNELIEISAELRYDGPTRVVEYSAGVVQVSFWLEQLDGPIYPIPGEPVPCVRYSLANGEPLAVPFRKQGARSSDGPLGEWYDQYFADPELRLPPGTYLVTATASGEFGGCGQGDGFGLEASLVIKVVDEPPTASVPLRTAPPNPSDECPGAEGRGTLVTHPESGFGLRREDGVHAVIWPNGFSTRHEVTGWVLLDAEGTPVAKAGDTIVFAAAYFSNGEILACGNFEVVTSP